jgi:hypothetical protein
VLTYLDSRPTIWPISDRFELQEHVGEDIKTIGENLDHVIDISAYGGGERATSASAVDGLISAADKAVEISSGSPNHPSNRFNYFGNVF